MATGGLKTRTDEIPRSLTTFVGRAQEAARLRTLLAEHRLVTLTGTGGVGKTRLAAEVTAQLSEAWADRVRWVDLTAVRDPDRVAVAVATDLGAVQRIDRPVLDAVVQVLSRERSLLVLDNCEQAIAGVATLCEGLLSRSDETRVLATSREPLRVPGEARLRLRSFVVPGPSGVAPGEGEGVALFTDRVRLVDPGFEPTPDALALIRQIVARVDGLPLAIELAAARYESLGLPELLERLTDPLAILSDGSRTAPLRHQSLRETVAWSYRLLTERQRQVFRRIGLFSAPFTLDAGRAVGGDPDGSALLHLVECCLVGPPRHAADGGTRYHVCEGPRAFALEQLADSGDEPGAAAAMCDYYASAATEAAEGIQSPGGEPAAARWFDAEDVLVHQALSWALEHDHVRALRLATGLAGWWRLRGRAVTGYRLLHQALESHLDHDDEWFAAQLWLGRLAQSTGRWPEALGHFTDVCEAAGPGGATVVLADGLAGRSGTLRNLQRLPEAVDVAKQALDLAVRLGYVWGEAFALTQLSLLADYAGEPHRAMEWAVRASRVAAAGIPDRSQRRVVLCLTIAHLDSGELASARQTCAEGLRLSRAAGDVPGQADFLSLTAKIALRAGATAEAGGHIRDALRLTAVSGDRARVLDCVDDCAHLCADTGRPAEALTLWAARMELAGAYGPELDVDTRRREDPMRTAARRLPSARVREAEVRGTAMSLEAATAFAGLLTDGDPPRRPEPTGTGLTPRERQVLALVAQGRTDAEIAQDLFISIRTVRSHLDRIRDKTGSRRRADLTRLALRDALV